MQKKPSIMRFGAIVGIALVSLAATSTKASSDDIVAIVCSSYNGSGFDFDQEFNFDKSSKTMTRTDDEGIHNSVPVTVTDSEFSWVQKNLTTGNWSFRLDLTGKFTNGVKIGDHHNILYLIGTVDQGNYHREYFDYCFTQRPEPNLLK